MAVRSGPGSGSTFRYRRPLLVAGFFAIGARLIACSSFSAAGSDEPDGSTTSDARDDSNGPPLDGSLDSQGPCPSGMVFIPLEGKSYCIDATEVTQEQYGLFLQSVATDAPTVSNDCKANITFVPKTCPKNMFDPISRGKYPVSCVDWCDAVAYCQWANKRLCGAVDGGSVAFGQAQSNASQWHGACSHHEDGLHQRAYGNVHQPTLCNGDGYDAGTGMGKDANAPIEVGRASDCVGGYPGLHDMMGNVYEWEDSCERYDAGEDGGRCRIRGGSFAGGPEYHYCAWAGLVFPRVFAAEDIGFRCCSP